MSSLPVHLVGARRAPARWCPPLSRCPICAAERPFHAQAFTWSTFAPPSALRISASTLRRLIGRLLGGVHRQRHHAIVPRGAHAHEHCRADAIHAFMPVSFDRAAAAAGREACRSLVVSILTERRDVPTLRLGKGFVKDVKCAIRRDFPAFFACYTPAHAALDPRRIGKHHVARRRGGVLLPALAWLQYRLGQPARRRRSRSARARRSAPPPRSSPPRSTPSCRASAAACSSTAPWSNGATGTPTRCAMRRPPPIVAIADPRRLVRGN